jgi:hypothetical protein
LWLGFPVRIDAVTGDGLIAGLSAALYAAGLAGVLTPWAVARMAWAAPVICVGMAFVAYSLVLACVMLGDAPLRDVLGTIPLVVLATATMTGGLSLILASVWPADWVEPPRTLGPDEVLRAIAGSERVLGR